MKTDLVGASIPSLNEFYTRDRGVIQRGDQGTAVKLLQEWLCLHGFPTACDGQFGPATQAALNAWRSSLTLMPSQELPIVPVGITNVKVDYSLWDALWQPMTTGLRRLPQRAAQAPSNVNLVPCTALEFARQHLAAGARELGINQGPWVRLYMSTDPVIGVEDKWCMAFVNFCVKQAIIQIREDVGYSERSLLWPGPAWSCDLVAEWADDHHLLHRVPNDEVVVPGSVFLINRSEHDWIHAGFVVSYDHVNGTVQTIEGNTSPSGSTDGGAVHRRFRAVHNMHFITGYGSEV